LKRRGEWREKTQGQVLLTPKREMVCEGKEYRSAYADPNETKRKKREWKVEVKIFQVIAH
jgi:hypothetical protein